MSLGKRPLSRDYGQEDLLKKYEERPDYSAERTPPCVL